MLIKPITRLQEDALLVRPGSPAESLPAILRLYPWRNLLRIDRLAWAAFIIALVGGIILAWSTIAEYLEYLRTKTLLKLGLFDFITPVHAAATSSNAIDPAALFLFQIMITSMLPLLAIGGFCVLIWARSPESRKAGKELLIGLAGFVLGALTRFL